MIENSQQWFLAVCLEICAYRDSCPFQDYEECGFWK